jgi:hypothetical protein
MDYLMIQFCTLKLLFILSVNNDIYHQKAPAIEITGALSEIYNL